MQGASQVLVEQKGGDNEDFGRGRKVHMTFGELVQQLQEGSNSLYLTTQEVALHQQAWTHHMHTSLIC